MAYVAGNPILSDKEFDELKLKLKVCSLYHTIDGDTISEHTNMIG